MFKIFVTLVLLTLSCESKQNQSEVKGSEPFIQRITDCKFINNSTDSVELMCNKSTSVYSLSNGINETYAKDSCYLSLFEIESKNISRLKVKYLKTGQCKSETLDASLAETFPKLLSLDISYLGYKISPHDRPSQANSFYFENIKKLNASYNQIGDVGDMLDYMEKISEIDLSHNKITTILAESFEVANVIKMLNLSHNSIVSLEVTSFEYFRKLLVLDLSYNSLEILDMDLFIFNDTLRVIHLENNQIKRLTFGSDFMPEFKKLTFFSAASNQIDNFNEIIIQCLGTPKLQVLDLSGNSLGHINSSMFHGLSNLQRLNFSHTNLTTFDFNAFEHPEKMISIDLSDNHLNEVNLSLTTNFTNLEHIFLQENDLKELANFSMVTFPKLESIDISMNWLSCEYAKETVQQWKEVKVVGDPCHQKTKENDIGNDLLQYGIAVLITILVASIFAGIWIIRWKTASKTRHQANETTPEQTSQQTIQQIPQDQHSESSSHTHYEEHVYSEIIEQPVQYNQLNFYPSPNSAILLHYENPRTANKDT